jgi:hypothetical protein
VLTVLVLLRKEAESPGLTGSYERHLPDGSLANRYNYRVVRLWQEDPDPYLTGGANLVPLAPLTKVTKAGLPRLVRRMAGRINAQPQPRADKLWFAAYLLMGWRYDKNLARRSLKGVWNMQESPFYQAILREGREEGPGRSDPPRQGRDHLEDHDPAISRPATGGRSWGEKPSIAPEGGGRT